MLENVKEREEKLEQIRKKKSLLNVLTTDFVFAYL